MRVKLLIAFFACVFCLTAQDLSVYGKLDPAQIQIGEQTTLRYEFAQPKDTKVSMPLLQDTIAKGVEIVEVLKPDTIDLGNGRIQINLDYIITSFDSGFYFIPAMQFASANEKIESRPIGLTVHTVKVNPETDSVKDIKEIMDAPFSWKELFKWVGIVLGILAVIALIAFILIKYVFKKKVPFIPVKEEIKESPDVVALRRLEQIKEEKLWQSGKIKEFYTELTEVVRVYIASRFDINAMEMTSEEIIALTRKHPDVDEVRTILRQILELSDLVKFAKFIPLDKENYRSIIDAFTFVEKTKVTEPEIVSDDAENPKNTDETVGKESKS